ncbi:MAG: Gfo/Idh/MocA family protein [Suipraeoptans sp.]
MTKLNFGMVGGAEGSFIGEAHRMGAQMNNMAVMVCGCFSRDMNKNFANGSVWGIDKDRVYPNYWTMAKEESQRFDGIDFVVIATPNNTHYEIAKCFLEYNIHVSCDKPVALKLKEVNELEEITARRNLKFGVSFTYVNYPMVHQLRNMVDNGDIGNVKMVMAEYPQDWVANAIDRGENLSKNWHFIQDCAGESAVTADIGVHLSCLIEMSTGIPIKKVLSRFSNYPNGLALETNTEVLFELDGGIPGMLWASQIALGYECGVLIRVFGDKGSLEWNHTIPTKLKYTRVNGPESYLNCGTDYLYEYPRKMSRLAPGHPEGFFEAFGNYYYAFCLEIVKSKTKESAPTLVYPTIKEGKSSMKFTKACIESNNAGNVWINIDDM